MLLYCCRHVSIRDYRIFVRNGDWFADGCGLPHFVFLLGKIGVCPSDGNGIFLTVVSPDTFLEIVAFDEDF